MPMNPAGALIGQMSVKELDQLVRIGGYATKSVSSTQLPATTDKDGPAGISLHFGRLAKAAWDIQ
ncbi:MAG: hypothetical protein ACLRYR_00045 [Bifidobacterium dentium]